MTKPSDRDALLQRVARADLVTSDTMIPSGTNGVKLFVRNKRAASAQCFGSTRTLLMVHSSTYPGEITFDLKLSGLSLMEAIAAHGYDVWLVDVRGYGLSTRPASEDPDDTEAKPVARSTVAVRDVAAAINHILTERHLDSLALLGWSWGTTLAGAYAVDFPNRVTKLVQLAPQWLRQTPSLADPGGPLSAYREVRLDQAMQRWLRGVPSDKVQSLIPDGWTSVWASQVMAADPWGAMQIPPVIRAPNGTVLDSREYWSNGRPIYDPGRIACPVLIVHGEWDQDLPLDMARAYFSLLTGAPYRRWVEIAEGTHSLLLEKNRLQLFSAVQTFLDEHFSPE